MKKNFSAFLLGSILFSANCQQKKQDVNLPPSSSTTENRPQKEKQPFKVTESGYKIISGFDDYFLKWFVILENPNTDLYGVFPTLTITARDENGVILGTEDQVLSELPPGTKIAFAGQISTTKQPKTVEFTPSKVEWKETITKPSDYLPFQVEKINFSSSGKNTATVSGDIKNPYSEDIDQLAVTSLLRNEEGKLIGGSTTFVDSLPANGSRPYSDKYVDVNEKATKAEVFVMPWGTTTWNQVVSKKDGVRKF